MVFNTNVGISSDSDCLNCSWDIHEGIYPGKHLQATFMQAWMTTRWLAECHTLCPLVARMFASITWWLKLVIGLIVDSSDSASCWIRNQEGRRCQRKMCEAPRKLNEKTGWVDPSLQSSSAWNFANKEGGLDSEGPGHCPAQRSSGLLFPDTSPFVLQGNLYPLLPSSRGATLGKGKFSFNFSQSKTLKTLINFYPDIKITTLHCDIFPNKLSVCFRRFIMLL